jgi:hypothetical protein
VVVVVCGVVATVSDAVYVVCEVGAKACDILHAACDMAATVFHIAGAVPIGIWEQSTFQHTYWIKIHLCLKLIVKYTFSFLV